MKYFYLSIKILFSIGLTSCSSLDLLREDNLIVITEDKETPLKEKIKEVKQKPIKNIESIITEKKTILSESKSGNKEEAKLIFDNIVKIGYYSPCQGNIRILVRLFLIH